MTEREKGIKAKKGRELRTRTSIARLLEKILDFCHVKQLKANCFTPCDAPKNKLMKQLAAAMGETR
jgi:hypothetical protein